MPSLRSQLKTIQHLLFKKKSVFLNIFQIHSLEGSGNYVYEKLFKKNFLNFRFFLTIKASKKPYSKVWFDAFSTFLIG